MPVTASTSYVMTALKKAVIGVIGVNVNVMTPSPEGNAWFGCSSAKRATKKIGDSAATATRTDDTVGQVLVSAVEYHIILRRKPTNSAKWCQWEDDARCMSFGYIAIKRKLDTLELLGQQHQRIPLQDLLMPTIFLRLRQQPNRRLSQGCVTSSDGYRWAMINCT
ncbi:hypothetical protein GPALN_004222 [Globodera pallida]|nr:hypothetical protein GPALN_004222 [Globodera pallida]